MAYLTALQQGWPTNEEYPHLADLMRPKITAFHAVNNHINGLNNSVNDGSARAFMWEWFTTKPFVYHYHNSSPVLLPANPLALSAVGLAVPIPWPSWLIAAHPTHAPAQALTPFLATYVRAFHAEKNRAGPDVEFIKDKFGYPGLFVCHWPLLCVSMLVKAGFLQSPEGGFDVARFVNTNITTLTSPRAPWQDCFHASWVPRCLCTTKKPDSVEDWVHKAAGLALSHRRGCGAYMIATPGPVPASALMEREQAHELQCRDDSGQSLKSASTLLTVHGSWGLE
ncbi:hypothetical protein C8Q74DRAFT_1366477 [Fomes fomentarius]|nr:hypothetical protein C8Q74DRAFT_1366477 [Fomes fomentarius]